VRRDEDRRGLAVGGGEGTLEPERHRLVGAGEGGHVGEFEVGVAPVEHDDAAALAREPGDGIGKDREGPAGPVRHFEPLVAQQHREADPAAQRARLQRHRDQVEQGRLLPDAEDRRDPAALGDRPVERPVGLDSVDAPALARLGQAGAIEHGLHWRGAGEATGVEEFAEDRLHG